MTRSTAILDAALTVQRDDIDATIRHWRNLGLRAQDIGDQLGCCYRWHVIRNQMIEIAAPHRKKPARTAIIALIGTRRQRGITQQDVARRLGISQRSISDYEKGNRRPTAETLAAWRAALGLRRLLAEDAPVRLAG